MFINNSFGKNMEILTRTMDVNVMRRDVIANNIANSDTPNFKRSDLNFEAQLKRALDSEKVNVFPALMTDTRHIAFDQKMDWRDVQPKKVLDYLTTAKNNGNNVDIEVEMMAALENQLAYQTMVQAVQSEYTRAMSVLK